MKKKMNHEKRHCENSVRITNATLGPCIIDLFRHIIY